jgi:uncharacterized membrane protein
MRTPVSTTHKNIATICAVEKAALRERSWEVRAGDAIAAHAGKMWSIILHAIWFAAWIGVNVLGGENLRFDPFPFSLLTMLVSLEAIFLSLFILVSQNQSRVQDDRRNHLDLQINLLAELENTKMIQMLQALCEHHKLKIGTDPEIVALAKRTEVSELITDLDKNMPHNNT